MTRNLTLALVAAIAAILLVVVAWSIPSTASIPESGGSSNAGILSLVLNVLGIVFSGAVGYFISYDLVEKDIQRRNESVVKENRRSLRDATAKSASELNDLFNNISYLEKTWQDIVKSTDEINSMLESSVANTLANIKSIIQSTTNKIIYISTDPEKLDGHDNPYGLYNFQTVALCSNLDCAKEIVCLDAPHYPHGSTKVKCLSCNTINYVRRNFDGSLRARKDYISTVAAGQPIKNGAYAEPSKSSEVASVAVITTIPSNNRWSFDVTCPHADCGNTVHIDAPGHFTYVNRGCTSCKSSFRLDLASKTAEIIVNKNSKELPNSALDTQIYECACGYPIRTEKAAQQDGSKAVGCVKCGAVYWSEKLPPFILT